MLTPNSHKLLSHEEIATIASNSSKNIDDKLDSIHNNFQQYHSQYYTDYQNYYCKSLNSTYWMRGRYSRFEDAICSVCVYKMHRYLSCSWIGLVLQKEKEFLANQRDSQKLAVASMTPLSGIESIEERKISKARISYNTLSNTEELTVPTPQVEIRYYIRATATAGSQNSPKK